MIGWFVLQWSTTRGFQNMYLLMSLVGITAFCLLAGWVFCWSGSLFSGAAAVKGMKHHREPIPTILLPRHTRLLSKYHRKLVPEKLDAVVVGSGMGSLMCASLLARLNWKVLVLEQHTEVGGSTHEFQLDGVFHDVGVHYCGDVHELEALWRLVSMDKIQWHLLGTPQNNHVYDEVHVDGEVYAFPKGAENWITYMSRQLPGHAAALRKYLRLLHTVTGWRTRLYFVSRIIPYPSLVKFVRQVLLRHFIANYVTSSVEQVLLREVTSDERLIKALCGQFGNYGVLPTHASFLTHACMVQHYMNGGYYPVGGSRQLAYSLLPIIHCAGGNVLVGHTVQRLVLDETGQRATGVQMLNGDIIHAPVIVSGIGLQNTWCKLLATEPLTPTCLYHRAYVESLKATTSFVYLFLKLRGTSQELGLKDCNIWHYPSSTSFAQLKNPADPLDLQCPLPLFVASNSAKDPGWKHANVSTVVVLTLAKTNWFSQWAGSRHGSREPSYLDFKARLGLKMFHQLQQIYPNIQREDVLSESVATPLTTRHFTASFACESYGLDNTTTKHEENWQSLFRPKTPIRGLYITGQDIVSTGVSGSCMSGVLTAHAICGYGSVGDVLSFAIGRERSLLTELEPLLTPPLKLSDDVVGPAVAATAASSAVQRII